ncbi:MAG TPA: hypothetical protein VG347_23180 [Verrucomicrobiae bacterium]|nr:hypothetical protein [Verrucomicrobiae bacterium]
MQTQANQNENNYKMSRLDEYRLWAMICDNELNTDINTKGQGLALLSAGQSNGGNEWLSAKRSRLAN